MKISRYGILPLLVILLICGLFSAIVSYIGLWYLSLIPFLFLVFSINFFRSPPTPGPKDDSILYSPANGKIVEVLKGVREEEYIKGEVWKISIFLNVFDVHVNASPVDGVIEYLNYVPGKKLDVRDPRASLENEYAMMGVKRKNDKKITVRQIAGLVARRIICDVKKGDTVTQCGVIGMIRFGSRAEICIPVDGPFTPAVVVGDKVVCGVSALGHFK
jgi:phosphatidylserine decarboxylase